MKPAGVQTTESGDMVALPFADPTAEARHIVESIQGLRGVAFAEDGVERGLSWSDMVILLRSVKANAEPITRALQAASIPFVVTGMANLFSTAEAGAARQLFYCMADRPGVDEAAPRNAWQAGDLGLDPAPLDRALAEVAQAKAALTDPEQKRWGQYSIQRVLLNFLEQAGLREELVPGGHGEVVFYNFGKFSQVITDFETIHQAKGMQWPVVFVPALLKNRFPAKKPGGRNVWHLLPRAGIKDQPRFEGTIEDERRLFYVAMTRSQKQIEISLGDGVTVNGRIDLVRRLDTGETTIVDLKSSDRAQAEEVTEAQLHVYALGYRDLTGRRPDYVEVYELDEGKRKPRSVDDDFITDVKQKVRDAAAALRTNTLPAAPVPKKCRNCDYGGMCTAGRSACAAAGGSAR